jgi:hypothetical protein
MGLAIVLMRREDFELVHFDEDAMLWSRHALLETLADPPPSYRFVVPPFIDDEWFASALTQKAFPAVLAELTRLHREQPDSRIGASLVQTLIQHPNATGEQRAALNALLP